MRECMGVVAVSDLLAWCEGWAKDRGYWVQNSAHRRKGWCVRAIDAAHLPPGFQVCRGGDDGFDGWTTLTPLQFWLWAHAVDTERLDSQRCPDCALRGGPMEWRQFIDAWHVSPITGGEYDARRYLGGWPNRGWNERSACWDVAAIPKSRQDPYTSTGARASRPCPTCSAKGYISRPLARVVCEAMPEEHERNLSTIGYACEFAKGIDESDFKWRKGSLVVWTDPGDPAARLALGFHADALQAEGDPLGQALALWLHGVPCDACRGARKRAWPAGGGRSGWAGSCEACHGDGTALGAFVFAWLDAEAKQAEANRLAQWRADCDALESETMEDLAADFLDAMADTLPPARVIPQGCAGGHSVRYWA